MLLSAIAAGILSFTPVSDSYKKCLDPVELFSKRTESVVYVAVEIEYDGQTGSGHGSGVVIDNKGTIVTSTHVVDHATDIKIVDDTGKVYEYSVMKMGHSESVTSLKPKNMLSFPQNFTAISNPQLRFGEKLYDIGYPLQYEKKIFAGELAGVEMFEELPLLVINVSVFPGLSGSPIFDCEGNIVGFVLAHDSRSNMLGLANLYTDAQEVL